MAAAWLRAALASVAEPLLHLRRAALAAFPPPPPGPPGPLGPLGPQPALGFKSKVSLRKRCRDCYLVKRRGRWFVLCRTHPRHKQRQL
ncbi:39S ribosomal protein L36, mitochondrial [Perognathus longimembris pacificus]|uniref:39S ribosomal protein L36, mitochondrial n=1 Tax=Perognathus longimembris pacificus TaxID=214514 RepID=UPI002019C7C8|nr:39S ribosomal protein L36, mitochondrial [Perognathus longimembris pacificus]